MPPQALRLALLDRRPITLTDLQGPLLEAAGAEILAEVVLDRMLEGELQRRGRPLSREAVEQERLLLLRSLDPDPDHAHRLLTELRQRRNLGPVRYEAFLRRNAALRLLIQDEVTVETDQVRRAYDLQYGQRYQMRLIVVESLQEAQRIVRELQSADGEGPGAEDAAATRQAAARQAFIDLAIARSIDPSRAQGGLLSPVSPVDAQYPSAIRDAMVRLRPGQVSAPIALADRFAIIRLEAILAGQDVAFDDVKEDLSRQVRRRLEALRMQQKALSLLKDAKLVVTDATLHAAWQQHLRRMQPE